MTADRSKGERQDAIVITGVGLVTPVGHDSISAPAAMHAGLSRFRKIPLFMTTSGAGAAGARASGLTDERSGSDRLLALAIPAAREALFCAEELYDELDLSRGRCLLSLAPEERPRYEPFGAEDVRTLLEESDATALVGTAELVRDGHAGGALALQRAVQLLREGSVDSCLVGGVDSLVEFPTLTWLNDAGRLKTDDHPDGFIPGEAAAFLVLETASKARGRGAPALAEIVATAFGKEEAHLLTNAPLQGVGLTNVLREALAAAGAPADGVLCDSNGEYWRTKEWCLAMTRVFAAAPAVPPLWQPAESVGDVGSASVPMLATVAVAALRRGYLPGPSLLVWASSDAGGRGSVVLRAPSADRAA
jgi:3-oxoacyl-[acyl-carrier-protein] synthase-1